MSDFLLLQKYVLLKIIVSYMEQLKMDLNLIKIYTKVIEFKSFSETSRRLGIPKSTLSRSVSALEKELKVQLILRTTRQFSLTHQGERFYQDCKKILNELDMALTHVMTTQQGKVGKIKLTAPLDFGEAILNPLVIEFCQHYPKIEFEISYNDEVVNIVREGFDLALRVGELKDSRLKTRKLCETSFTLVVSPSLLPQYGWFQTLDELKNCPYLHFSRIRDLKKIKFLSGQESFYIQNRPIIALDHLQSLKNMVLAGKGFALIPDFFVKAELQKDQLVSLYKNYKTASIDVSWVFPEHKENSLIVKNFRDFVTPRIVNR